MNHLTHAYFNELVGVCQNVLPLLLLTCRLQNYQVWTLCHWFHRIFT